MITDKLGNLTLYNADCMEIMKSMPDKSVDFILTDIPYELNNYGGVTKAGHGFDRALTRQKGKDCILDFISHGIDYDAVFTEFERLCKIVNVCIFCSNKQVGKIMTWWENKGYVATLLVWDKPNPIPLGQNHYISNLEFIVFIMAKGATYNNLGYEYQLKTFRYAPPIAKDRIHETEKPKELLCHLLRLHTNENDLVFDPYAGSFSLAIACHDLDRKFIGCEILPDYYEKAVKRIKNHQLQLRLF